MKMTHSIAQYFFRNNPESNIKTESFAGLTSFLTMVYIIFVNPQILAAAGISSDSAFIATCLAAALGCFLMGFIANLPLAVAPGMGLNAYFAYVVVNGLGYSWHTALALVFISGLVFVFLSLTRLREYLIQSIPKSIVIGIAAGLGLFLAFIALKNAGIIIPDSNTLVKFNSIQSIEPLLFLLGFILTLTLSHYRVTGAIVIAIVAVTFIAIMTGFTSYHGIFAFPSLHAVNFFQLDFSHLLQHQTYMVIFSFFLVSLFDATGTIVGVLQGIGFSHSEALPKLSKALLADSLSISAAAILGTSNTTAYVESAAGVQAGGRTGLTAVVVGILFLLALFFAPLAQTIPSFATAPALLFVACLMFKNIIELEWQEVTEYVPGIITAVMIPFSFSVADGVGCGFIVYTLLQIFTRKFHKLNWILIVFTFLFIIQFIYHQ